MTSSPPNASLIYKVTEPFYRRIADEWGRCRISMQTDDLLVLLDVEKADVLALPRVEGLEQPEIRNLVPPDVLERLHESPGIKEGHFRSFWVLVFSDRIGGWGCLRLSVKGGSELLPS